MPPAHFPIQQHNRKSSNFLLPVTLFSLAQMTSTLVQRHVLWSYRPYQNLGKIDHDLHYRVFDDVTCKPPIVTKSEKHCDNLKFFLAHDTRGAGKNFEKESERPQQRLREKN